MSSQIVDAVDRVGRFVDRADAGWRLAERLESYRGTGAVVLGLPRGGVPVAYQVASALDAPLDVIVVRKLGVPFQPEVAMGAIGEDGVRFLDHSVIRRAGVTEAELAAVEAHQQDLLDARLRRYRRGRERVDITGRTAIVVDDGVATGSTARVACRIARLLGASRVVLAVPVGPPDALDHMPEADEVVAVRRPLRFQAVGYHYDNFAPTTDDEVVVLLDRAARRIREGRATGPADCDIDVEIPAGDAFLQGHLHLPERARGVVVLAHGSGTSRYSPRNRLVADVLFDAGLGTFILDLLTPTEEHDRRFVFDIDLLADRLSAATDWVLDRSEAPGARVGYFADSTAAGAAIVAAARRPDPIAAVVSRGGRPDLAADRLDEVKAPTLLLVGSEDPTVAEHNREALAHLGPPSRLVVIDGASHLFEEPGVLAEAAVAARDWFVAFLLDDATV